MKTKIPIVDLANLKQVENPAQDPEWISIAKKTREGFGDVGFLYLINHGISEKMVTEAFEEGKHFFNLHVEENLAYKKKDTSSTKTKMFDYDQYAGYTPQGTENTRISAEPIPGSIMINAGDLTEFRTSGIFPATPHRVFINEENDEKRQKSRYSIGLFCGADHQTMITPMDLEKRPEELKRMEDSGIVYSKQPISAYDHVMMRAVNPWRILAMLLH